MNSFIKVLKQGLAELRLDLTEEQLKQCEVFAGMLIQRNQTVNLTAITGEEDVAVKHFLDSLAAGQYIDWDTTGDVLDLGAGAGFPGLVLKIWQQERRFVLVDAVLKKVNFMSEVIEEINLSNVEAVHQRGEELGRIDSHREQYGIVVARAVAHLSTLSEYCLPLVAPGGYFYALKGPNFQQELDEAKEAVDILGGQVEKVIKYMLPISGDARSLVVVKKVKTTPKQYPRRSGLPGKRPLGSSKQPE